MSNNEVSPEMALAKLINEDQDQEHEPALQEQKKGISTKKTTVNGTKTSEQIIHFQPPEICKSLNANQIAFANELFKTKNPQKSAKIVGYNPKHGYELKRDIRVQMYIRYLSAEHAKNAEIGYSELIARLAERFFDDDNPLEDSDLPKFSKEIRELKQDIKGRQPAMSVSISLPDTYNQFFNVQSGNDKNTDGNNLQEIPVSKPNDIEGSV